MAMEASAPVYSYVQQAAQPATSYSYGTTYGAAAPGSYTATPGSASQYLPTTYGAPTYVSQTPYTTASYSVEQPQVYSQPASTQYATTSGAPATYTAAGYDSAGQAIYTAQAPVASYAGASYSAYGAPATYGSYNFGASPYQQPSYVAASPYGASPYGQPQMYQQTEYGLTPLQPSQSMVVPGAYGYTGQGLLQTPQFQFYATPEEASAVTDQVIHNMNSIGGYGAKGDEDYAGEESSKFAPTHGSSKGKSGSKKKAMAASKKSKKSACC